MSRALTPRSLRRRGWPTSDRGVTAVEYALIIGLVAVVITVGVSLVGSGLTSLFSGAAAKVVAGGDEAPADPCTDLTATGTPAPTCDSGSGIALWTCESGHSVSDDGAYVTCIVDTGIPGVPSLSASKHESHTRLTFAADDGGSPITGFVVERADDDDDGCGGSLVWATVTGSGASPFGTSFDGDNCWRVAAVNGVGQGPWSSILYHEN